MTAILNRLRQPGAIRVEFQPIFRVHADSLEVYAYEALSRGPRGTSMERPAVMFDYARRKGAEATIDLLCIAEALVAATTLPGQPLISLNVHGATLASVEDFTLRVLGTADAVGITPDRLMLEVVEHRTPWIVDAFRTTLDELRDAGVHIAVDDLGIGASNFQMVVDCHPDHLKIDRYVVHGCSRDPWRRAVLQSVVALARECNALLIGEGVEEVADLEVLLDAGIDVVQGWLYAASKPALELAINPLPLTRTPRCMKGTC